MKSSHELESEFGGSDVASTSRSFIQVVWQRKAFVILGACVGLTLAFLWHTQKANVYSAQCQLLVIKKHGTGGMLNSAADPRTGFVEDFMSTHMTLLRSSLILEPAVQKRNLKELKTFEHTVDPVGQIQASLFVTRDSSKETSNQQNNIITLGFRGPVSEDCNKIIEAVIESYKAFLDLTYKNVSDDTVLLINKARDTLNTELKDAERKYYAFRNDSEVYYGAKSGYTVETERIMQIENKRQLVFIRMTETQERITTLEKAINNKEGIDVATFLSPNAERATVQHESQVLQFVGEPLVKLHVDLEQLLSLYGPNHPDVLMKKVQIEKTREKLTEIAPKRSAADRDPAKMLLNALRYEQDELKNVHDRLAKELVTLKSDAKRLNTFDIEDMRLKNDVERYRQLYDVTIKRLTEITLVRDQGGFEPRLLAPPGIGLKVAPVFMNDMALGLVLGLMVGFGLAYLADLADKSFRSPDEIRRQLGMPIVGHIPFFQPDTETAKRRADGDTTIDPMLCTYFKPKSLDSEAYRAVRTSLFFSTQGQGHKIIQVTSPNKGDGKSLLISNLAIVTAQSGKRVLMIDADCRRPRQHKVLNVRNDIGLTTVLNGTAEPHQAVQETSIPGLSVMGSGPIPPNPSELLVSPKFKETLELFRKEYDYVFVDTPPLLAVTDPCIVAGMVDGLFLAIRLTRKGRPDAERAREILQSLGAQTFGIVVNGVTRTNAGLYSSTAYDYTDKYMDYEEDNDHAYYYAEDDDEAAKQNDK